MKTYVSKIEEWGDGNSPEFEFDCRQRRGRHDLHAD